MEIFDLDGHNLGTIQQGHKRSQKKCISLIFFIDMHKIMTVPVSPTLVLGNVVSQSSHFQNRFQISVQTPVDNPESTIDTFSRQFQIPQMQTEIVKQAFYLEQGATMFHIIQAFTRAAHDRSLSAADSYRMEKAGGTILSMVKS